MIHKCSLVCVSADLPDEAVNALLLLRKVVRSKLLVIARRGFVRLSVVSWWNPASAFMALLAQCCLVRTSEAPGRTALGPRVSTAVSNSFLSANGRPR